MLVCLRLSATCFAVWTMSFCSSQFPLCPLCWAMAVWGSKHPRASPGHLRRAIGHSARCMVFDHTSFDQTSIASSCQHQILCRVILQSHSHRGPRRPTHRTTSSLHPRTTLTTLGSNVRTTGIQEYPEWTCMLQILESLLRKTLDLERFLHTMSAVSDLIDNSLGENTWGYRPILQFRTPHGVLNQTFFEYFRMTQDDLNGIIHSKTASAVILPVLRASKFSGYSGHIEVILRSYWHWTYLFCLSSWKT